VVKNKKPRKKTKKTAKSFGGKTLLGGRGKGVVTTGKTASKGGK